MRRPKVLYIIIILICIIAVGVGVYTQFFTAKGQGKQGDTNNTQNNEEVVEEPNAFETMKENFNLLFDNKFSAKENTEFEVEKKKKAEEIVYTVFTKKEETDFYDIDINVPFINIKGDIPGEFNQITQTVFLSKANEILKNTDASKRSIYSIDYTANLSGEILSVVIKSSLKQGDNPQRIIVQTYNYNIKTKEKVKIDDILTIKSIGNEEINNKITEMIQKAIKSAETLTASGYSVYKRNINDEMYIIDNINTFFLGNNSKLYIIFAYGNKNFTSEMDVLEF